MSDPNLVPLIEPALTIASDSGGEPARAQGTKGTLSDGSGKPRRQWVRAFLAELARTGNVTRSARRARVGRRTVYKKFHACDNFRQAWVSAEERFADQVEAEIVRRSLTGWEEPV
jgi:hypothetical protein